MMKEKAQQHGFSLIELLVSISIFSIIGLGIVGYITDTLKRLGLESRAAIASQELNNAVNLLQAELRMATSVSPYNVGSNPALVTCAAQLTATTTTLRFLVVHDNPTSPSGIQSYYVGYSYNPSTRILYRGEVASPAITSCTLPGADPLTAPQILARNIVRVDGDNNGTVDPIFNFTSPELRVNMGVEVIGPGGLSITQKVSNAILARAL